MFSFNIFENANLFIYSILTKSILHDLLKIVTLLVAIAYYTLAERKIMAAVQRRKGPNVVGLYGLLQPLADGLKLLLKELLIPSTVNPGIFLLAPWFILSLNLLCWIVISTNLSIVTIANLPDFLIICMPSFEFIKLNLFTQDIANLNYAILFLLAISSFNVYGIIIAGWASNSKYAFLGSLRSAAQMISYEVSIGLVILPVILLSGSLNFTKIIYSQFYTIWYIVPLLPCGIIFFVSMLAETNRTPFDLTEAEAELVAGYNTEYSSIVFAMFFLAEYSSMILMSAIMIALFFGGWLFPFIVASKLISSLIFSIKTLIFCFLFVLVRATFPRYRYDQLMNIGWKNFLPLSLAYLVFIAALLIIFNGSIFINEII